MTPGAERVSLYHPGSLVLHSEDQCAPVQVWRPRVLSECSCLMRGAPVLYFPPYAGIIWPCAGDLYMSP